MRLRTLLCGLWLALHLWFIHPFMALAEPILQSQVGEKIGVVRLRSGVLPGVVIGSHHEGMLKIRQQRYTATGNLDDRLEEVARRIIEDELAQAGYPLAGANHQSVFADQLPDETEPPRFLIGGTVTRVTINTFDSWFGGTTEEQRTIRWEVLDRETNRIIANRETSGQAQASGVDNPEATYATIRQSFRAFLEETQLQAQLQQVTVPIATTTSRPYTLAAHTDPNRSLPVGEIVRRSLPAVALVKAGTARGSGFFIDPSLLITNQHVVGSAFSVQLELYDGSRHTAKVLKRDAKADLALLQVNQPISELTGLSVCHTGAVRVGDEVFAIGNPLRLTNTVTRGIISAVRTTDRRHLIQTDVAINPGNSGGPLFNQYGAVVGIITEKFASTGVEGLGFALPIAESLQHLGIEVETPEMDALNACGNPVEGILTSQLVQD